MKISYNIILCVGVVLCAAGCDAPPKMRVYQERVPVEPVQEKRADQPAMPALPAMGQMPQNPAMRDLLENSVAKVSLRWDTPEGWIEEKGTGMRLVTFRTPDSRIVCTIVSLAGHAGGKAENILRWAGQLGLQLSASELGKFMDQIEEKENLHRLPLAVINFTSLSSQADQPSMLAAIMSSTEQHIFIKMTGARDHVRQEEEAFNSLLDSLRVDE